MPTLTEKLDRALYPSYARNWDDQLFRERILQRLTPTTVDLGAGARGHRPADELPGAGRAGLRRRSRSPRRR